MALTRITKGVIKPNENYDTHNINSTGIVTAIGLDVNGNGDISGNLSVGGILTYEDVTSIDSVGIITARNGIDCNGDLDVDGHTNLDNVNIAGVTTITGSGSSVLFLESSNPLIRLTDTDNGAHSTIGGEGGNLYLYTNSSSRDFIFRGSAEVARITGDGKLGIGTHTPTAPFQINNVSPKIILEDNDNAADISIHNVGGAAVYSSAGDVVFQTLDTTERLRITSNGKVGIGSDAPHRPLSITTSDATVHLFNGNGGIYMGTDNSGGFIKNCAIARSGATNYHIGGSTAGDLCIGGEAAKSMIFGLSHATGAMHQAIHISRLREFNFYYGSQNFKISTGDQSSNVERLRISSNGDVRIGSGTPSTFGSGTTVLETHNASTYTANLVTSGTHILQMIASQTHGATSIGTRSNHSLNLCVNDSTKVTIDTSGQITNTGIATSFVTTNFAANFAKLDIRGTNIANSNHYILSYGAGHANNQEFHMVNTLGDLVFRTGTGSDTDRLRIDSSGQTDFKVGSGEVDIYSTGSGEQHSLRLLNSDASAGNEIGIYFGPANNVAGAYISGYAYGDFASTANRDAGLRFGVRQNGTFKECVRINHEGFFQATNIENSYETHTFAADLGHQFNSNQRYKTTLWLRNTNTNFENGMFRCAADRAASTSYHFITCTSGDLTDDEFRVRGDGKVYGDNNYTVGADYAEYFEWSDGNSSNQDRRGMTVVLDGNKVKLSTSSDSADNIIGVVSGSPSVVGDSSWSAWSQKYLKDDYNQYILDSDGHRQLNSSYDNTKTYTPRAERQEWDAIGMVGKLRIVKGQKTGTRWIKMRDISDTVEEWLVR